MSDFEKLINAVSTPAAQVVGDVIEKAGKVSGLGGGVVYAIDKATSSSYTMTEYAAMVSMVGGLVWIAKMIFDSFISWLKYRRGDK